MRVSVVLTTYRRVDSSVFGLGRAPLHITCNNRRRCITSATTRAERTPKWPPSRSQPKR